MNAQIGMEIMRIRIRSFISYKAVPLFALFSLGRKPKGLARMVEHVPLAEEICCGIAHDKMYFKSFYGNSEQTPGKLFMKHKLTTR